MKPKPTPLRPAGKPNVRLPPYRPRVVEMATRRNPKHRPGKADLNRESHDT